jgi:hypothetical protein
MIAPNRDPLSCGDSTAGERALQLQFQSLLLSLRKFYFSGGTSTEERAARTERQLLADLLLVGEQLKAANPDHWSP